MIKKHLKRLTIPRTWPLHRKELVYVTRPLPGKKMEYSMPLNVVLRDLIGVAKSTRETKYLLKEKEVVVDGKKRTEHKYPIGLMDVVSFPEIDEHYRINLTPNGKLTAVKTDKKRSVIKYIKIIGKTLVKGKTQLNLFDSRNVIVDKDTYKVGDSVVMQLPEQKITGNIKLDTGAYVILVSGKYSGQHGVVENIGQKNIIINLSTEKKIETLKKYAFAIGKGKPEIKLPE